MSREKAGGSREEGACILPPLPPTAGRWRLWGEFLLSRQRCGAQVRPVCPRGLWGRSSSPLLPVPGNSLALVGGLDPTLLSVETLY